MKSYLGRLVFILVASVVLVFVGSVVLKVSESRTFFTEHQRIWQMIYSLNQRRPVAINKDAWESSVGWCLNAHCNVNFCPGPRRFEAMQRYGKNVEERLQRDVDVDTLNWIFDSAAEIGPYGKEYTDRFRSMMRDEFNARQNR